MERCSCYHFYQGAGVFYSDGVCYGTKEREPCSCGGDPVKCDFYPEKRKASICDLYDTQSKQCEPYKPCICPYDGDTSKCTFDDEMIVRLPDPSEIVLPKKDEEEIERLVEATEIWLEGQNSVSASGLAEAMKQYGKQPKVEFSMDEIIMIQIPNHNPGREIMGLAPVMVDGSPIGVVNSHTDEFIECLIWQKHLPVNVEISGDGRIIGVNLGNPHIRMSED